MSEPSKGSFEPGSGIAQRFEMALRSAYNHVRGSLGALLESNRRIPFGVLAVWASLYGARPFRLGFYTDDWWALVEPTHGSAPFLLERLKMFLGPETPYAARPVDAILMFLVNSIAGTSAFAYQLVAAVFVLLAALSLRAWFAALLPQDDFPSRTLAADLATIFWLSIPWSVASTAWPVLAPAAMGSQILFTEASRRILPPRQISAKTLALLGLGLTASYLTYEPFYFQFFLVAGFYLVFERENFKTRFSSVGLIIAALGSQLLAVAVNRAAKLLNPTFAGRRLAKEIVPNWFGVFVASLQGLPHQLEYSVGALGELWIGLVLVCLIISLVLVLRGLIDRRLLRPTKRLLGIFLMGTVALPVAILTYSLAGYGVGTVGISARTLQGVSWAMTIIVFSLVSMLLLPHGKLARLTSLVALLSIIILNCIGQERLVEDWAFVWRQEKEVLAHAPIERLKNLPRGSTVLYIGPSYYHGMVVFGAYWDITGAVFSLPPLSRGRRHYHGLTQIHSAATEYVWHWDGKDLIQEEPGYWTLNFPAKRLFLWNYERGDVVEAPVGYRIGPEELKAYAQ
jgi:hypothetical protein